MTRPRSHVLEAQSLLSAGLTQAETARQLGIPRSTIRTWIANGFVAKQLEPHAPGACPHVDRAAENPTYAYLLGLYLGDGCISTHPRGVYRLRIALDMKYPEIIAECHSAMEDVLPNRVTRFRQSVAPTCRRIRSTGHACFPSTARVRSIFDRSSSIRGSASS